MKQFIFCLNRKDFLLIPHCQERHKSTLLTCSIHNRIHYLKVYHLKVVGGVCSSRDLLTTVTHTYGCMRRWKNEKIIQMEFPLYFFMVLEHIFSYCFFPFLIWFCLKCVQVYDHFRTINVYLCYLPNKHSI